VLFDTSLPVEGRRKEKNAASLAPGRMAAIRTVKAIQDAEADAERLNIIILTLELAP